MDDKVQEWALEVKGERPETAKLTSYVDQQIGLIQKRDGVGLTQAFETLQKERPELVARFWAANMHEGGGR